jgi:hypothetical protein
MGYPGVEAWPAQECPIEWTVVLFIGDPSNGTFNTSDYLALTIVLIINGELQRKRN